MSSKNFIIVGSHNKKFQPKNGIGTKALINSLHYLLFLS